MSNTNSTHCCERMDFFLEEEKVAIYYDLCCRKYYIRLYTSNGLQGIFYCPWCGQKLPQDLHDLYYATLDEMGYEPHDENIPEKYKTDEWWRERDDLQ